MMKEALKAALSGLAPLATDFLYRLGKESRAFFRRNRIAYFSV
jgi:hypothetical protein